MQCYLLGSGGMMPMPHRRLTSVAVRHEGRVYLLDCGEGTQVPYKEQHIGMRDLNLVAISHKHADHVLGLPGMLMLRAQMPDAGPLTILGTPGIRRFISNVRADLGMHINYPIDVCEWKPGADGLAYEDEHVRVLWYELEHTVRCVGYRIEEKERPGRFDAEAAVKLGVPRGPLWGKLQGGQEVQTPSGDVVSPDQVLGPPRRGRHVAYATDTRVTPKLQPLLKDADLAFVESMFESGMEQDAAEKRHMTISQAAGAAREAGVKKLVLVHLSPRYESSSIKRLAVDAQDHHPDVRIGRDGKLFELRLTD
ncbi:MAG: ribonuclease Z [Deltaproteobacteria bacterium]|nr:ribonuclease Z [Deltaproteobacteria bacterium]